MHGTTNYHVQTLGTVLSHFSARTLLLRDGSRADTASAAADDEIARLQLQAKVSSGDYFVTLGTEVERIAFGLGAQGLPEVADLERIASELMYLDKKYKIVRK